MATATLRLICPSSIPLRRGLLEAQTLVDAAQDVNERLQRARSESLGLLDIFDVIDFRMLSGLIGEIYSQTLSEVEPRLLKNPNIDGYPDLCDVSNGGADLSIVRFIAYPHGGIEVKNTFGVKKSGSTIEPRQSRVGLVNRQLVWKAHHQHTNNLLALRSDYVDGIPQLVAGYFSADLNEADWTTKQNPKAGSTMTSFCQTKGSGFAKLERGLLFGAAGYTDSRGIS